MSSHSGDLATAFDGVWKGLTALAGIYLLFIIEHCIGMFKHYKDHKVRARRTEPETLLHLLFGFLLLLVLIRPPAALSHVHIKNAVM